MFNKEQKSHLKENHYYSNGHKSLDALYQKEFHTEDTLLDLINEKSGLVDEKSRIRLLTNTKKETIEFQLHFDYDDNNRENFVNAMTNFLNTSANCDLGLVFENKQTMKFTPPYPTLTMNRDHLDNLISRLEKADKQPLNTSVLQGEKILQPVCF